MIAPALGGLLVHKGGFSLVFMASAGVGLVALLSSLLLPADRRTDDDLDDDDDDLLLYPHTHHIQTASLVPELLRRVHRVPIGAHPRA